MAKRFIDTGFFDSPSIRRLPSLYKLFWLYLVTNCDHAGIWPVDFPKASFMCGGKIKKDVAEEKLKRKFIKIDNGNRWFIPGFISYQYPTGLNPKNKAHKSVLLILQKFKINGNIAPTLAPYKPLHGGVTGGVSQGGKDMDKDLDKDMDKDLDKDMDKDLELGKIENQANQILEKLNDVTGCNFTDTELIIENLMNGKTVKEHLYIINVKKCDPYFIENPQFMVPGTLFGKKFNKYIDQKPEMFKKNEESKIPPGNPPKFKNEAEAREYFKVKK